MSVLTVCVALDNGRKLGALTTRITLCVLVFQFEIRASWESINLRLLKTSSTQINKNLSTQDTLPLVSEYISIVAICHVNVCRSAQLKSARTIERAPSAYLDIAFSSCCSPAKLDKNQCSSFQVEVQSWCTESSSTRDASALGLFQASATQLLTI